MVAQDGLVNELWSMVWKAPLPAVRCLGGIAWGPPGSASLFWTLLIENYLRAQLWRGR